MAEFLRVAALAAATALTCASAWAGTFQVVSGQQRAFILSAFGDTGQSFVAVDPILNSVGFQFTALNPINANLPFTFSLFAGQTLTGTALVTRTVTLPATIGSTPTWYDFELGSTAVTAGGIYTAVLSSGSSRVGPVLGPDINIFTGAELSGDAYVPGRALFTREVYPNCPLTGNCDLNFRVTGTAAATAVPEPASWAMMVGGFALAGAALRRRARPLHAPAF